MGIPFLSRLTEAMAVLRHEKGLVGLLDNADDPHGILQGILNHGRTPPLRRTEDFLLAYSQLPWLRATVGKIGFATASTTWQIFVDTGQNGEPVRNKALQRAPFGVRHKMIAKKKQAGELIELPDHQILDLLETFNPVMTGLAGLKITQHHLDLVGEAFWLKQRGPLNEVVALWPLPPPWVKQTPSMSNPTYEVSWQAFQAFIPESEVVWFCDNDPLRPYDRGSGTALALGDELETDEYAAKHTKVEFYNRGVPEILITAEGMGDSETRRLERDWSSKNRTVFKQLQVYFLNRKVDVKQLGQSFKSLQLIQLREFERDIVVQVFGVPPEILGIINNSNRATIDASDFLFSRWVLVPRLELQRTVMQERLVADFDERLILDYVSPVQEDIQQRLAAFKANPATPLVDEWREIQGLEALPDGRGQVHLINSSIIQTTFGTEEEEVEPKPEPEDVIDVEPTEEEEEEETTVDEETEEGSEHEDEENGKRVRRNRQKRRVLPFKKINHKALEEIHLSLKEFGT